MKKQEIISFKADRQLLEELNRIPNRSEFIRNAILQAMENTCPLCQGTGILSPSQREHWETFARHHSAETCEVCNETYITCDHHEVIAHTHHE